MIMEMGLCPTAPPMAWGDSEGILFSAAMSLARAL